MLHDPGHYETQEPVDGVKTKRYWQLTEEGQLVRVDRTLVADWVEQQPRPEQAYTREALRAAWTDDEDDRPVMPTPWNAPDATSIQQVDSVLELGDTKLVLDGEGGFRLEKQPDDLSKMTDDALTAELKARGWNVSKLPPAPVRKSKYRVHCEKWGRGCGSELCERARRVVLARGSLPCDVFLLGEAPGASEDVLGIPFAGPAGHLLDQIVRQAVPEELKTGYGNLVGCIPLGEDGGKTGEPPPEAIQQCAPRLEELVRLANPKLLVCVGQLAEAWVMGTKGKKHLLKWYKGKTVAINHPAFILRSNVAARSLLIQKAIVTLSTAVEETFDA